MVIDVFCLVVGLSGLWIGYTRGIISTVLNLLSVLFGVMAAAKFSPAMTDLLTTLFGAGESSHGFMLLAGVILTFVLTLVVFRMLARGLEEGLESFNINFINQVLGGVITALVFIFLYSLIIVFANRSRLIEDATKQDSTTYAFLEKYPEVAWGTGRRVWPIFVEFYEYSLDIMDRIDDTVEKKESEDFFDIPDDENTSTDDGATTTPDDSESFSF
jgi:membrane protein required for colicin V production